MREPYDDLGDPGGDSREFAPREFAPMVDETARRELVQLLAEIRSRTPSPAQVVEAVRNAAAGELSDSSLDQIARDIHALYRRR
jgi:hypothetical protein